MVNSSLQLFNHISALFFVQQLTSHKISERDRFWNKTWQWQNQKTLLMTPNFDGRRHPAGLYCGFQLKRSTGFQNFSKSINPSHTVLTILDFIT